MTNHEIQTLLRDLKDGRITTESAYQAIRQESDKREMFWFAITSTIICLVGIAFILISSWV
jgi:uncharacterized membrane protein YccC